MKHIKKEFIVLKMRQHRLLVDLLTFILNAIFHGFIISDISHYNNATDESDFDKIWGQFSTVPLFLIIIMFPLINLKSATFFTKFNALGKCVIELKLLGQTFK